jgi:hypothetical protein
MLAPTPSSSRLAHAFLALADDEPVGRRTSLGAALAATLAAVVLALGAPDGWSTAAAKAVPKPRATLTTKASPAAYAVDDDQR